MVWSCTLVARAHLLKSFDLEPISGEEPRRDKRARFGGELASASLQHESPGVGDQRHLSARSVTDSPELDTAHALEVDRSSRRVRVSAEQPGARPGGERAEEEHSLIGRHSLIPCFLSPPRGEQRDN